MELYTLNVLLAQRKCSYPGEYAPEALEVADEYAWDENPENLNEKLKEYEATGEFTRLRIVKVTIPYASVDAALDLTPPVIPGAVAPLNADT